MVDATGRNSRLASARAGPEAAHLATAIRQGPQEPQRSFDIAHHLVIGDTPRGPHFGRDIFWSAMAVTVVEVGRNRHETVVRKLPRGFTVPLIPARQVMDQDHPWIGPGAQGPGAVGVNEIAVGAANDDGFRQHTFILVRLVHIHPPCFC